MPKFTPIAKLQHEYLSNLISCNPKLTVKEALYRISLLNQYEARRRLAQS
jgi:hypothetical protein